MATVKTWQEMTREEREAFKKDQRDAASEVIKRGEAPAALAVSFGKTNPLQLLAMPSGVSEKGSVAYRINSGIFKLANGKRIRINNLSISVLNDSEHETSPINLADANVL